MPVRVTPNPIIPPKASGRPRKIGGKWGFDSLPIGGYRVVPHGVMFPAGSVKHAATKMGFNYAARTVKNELRVYRVA